MLCRFSCVNQSKSIVQYSCFHHQQSFIPKIEHIAKCAGCRSCVEVHKRIQKGTYLLGGQWCTSSGSHLKGRPENKQWRSVGRFVGTSREAHASELCHGPKI